MGIMKNATKCYDLYLTLHSGDEHNKSNNETEAVHIRMKFRCITWRWQNN